MVNTLSHLGIGVLIALALGRVVSGDWPWQLAIGFMGLLLVFLAWAVFAAFSAWRRSLRQVR